MLTMDIIGNLVFALGICLYWIGVFIILYHLIRFGVSGQPKKIAIIFLAGSLVLTLTTVLLFIQVDFSFMGMGGVNLFNFDSLGVPYNQ